MEEITVKINVKVFKILITLIISLLLIIFLIFLISNFSIEKKIANHIVDYIETSDININNQESIRCDSSQTTNDLRLAVCKMTLIGKNEKETRFYVHIVLTEFEKDGLTFNEGVVTEDNISNKKAEVLSNIWEKSGKTVNDVEKISKIVAKKLKLTDATEEEITYDLAPDGESYIITKVNPSLKDISIPKKNQGLPVTTIASYAFKGCINLSTVKIPNTITNIESYAFEGCTGLTNISIPSSVKNIGVKAFDGCTNLSLINVDNNNDTYDSRNYCNAIIETFTNKLLIGFKTTVIPNDIITIGNSAFEGCTYLDGITIPASVKSIGEKAFAECTSLKTVAIAKGDITIGNGAFMGCSNLTNITLPEGLTIIGESAFEGCSDLKNITIPYGVTSIGKNAFGGCEDLKSINISSSVRYIGESAFNNCNNLESVIFEKNSLLENIGRYAFFKCNSLSVITIPNSVKNIEDGTFRECETLTNISLSNRIQNIGEFAFYGCYNLREILIPNSVTNIGSQAFKYCNGLSKIYYDGSSQDWEKIASDSDVPFSTIVYYKASTPNPDGDYWNGDDENPAIVNKYSVKFENNGTLHKEYEVNENSLISKPNDPTKNGYTFEGWYKESTFVNVWDFKKDVVTENITLYAKWREIPYFLVSFNSNGGTKINDKEIQENLTITEPTEPIKEMYTFEGWYKESTFVNVWDFKKDVVTENITLYAKWKYVGSSGLEIKGTTLVGLGSCKSGKLGIPPTVTSIADEVFMNCGKFSTIIVPDSVESIGKNAFSGCYNLEFNTYDNAYYLGNESNPYLVLIRSYDDNITMCEINSGTRFIVGSAFKGCWDLIEISIPKGVSSIGYQAFSGCWDLKNVLFEENSSLKIIDEMAFRSCSKIKSIILPDSVLSIGARAFDGCTVLSNIVMPASITHIGDYAFLRCDITSIILSINLVSIGEDIFANCSNLKYKYYEGTAEDFGNVSMDYIDFHYMSNSLYYYSEIEPTVEGNYWYYDVDGNPVIWEKEQATDI